MGYPKREQFVLFQNSESMTLKIVLYYSDKMMIE